jgi:hypothetical protein
MRLGHQAMIESGNDKPGVTQRAFGGESGAPYPRYAEMSREQEVYCWKGPTMLSHGKFATRFS